MLSYHEALSRKATCLHLSRNWKRQGYFHRCALLLIMLLLLRTKEIAPYRRADISFMLAQPLKNTHTCLLGKYVFSVGLF